MWYTIDNNFNDDNWIVTIVLHLLRFSFNYDWISSLFVLYVRVITVTQTYRRVWIFFPVTTQFLYMQLARLAQIVHYYLTSRVPFEKTIKRFCIKTRKFVSKYNIIFNPILFGIIHTSVFIYIKAIIAEKWVTLFDNYLLVRSRSHLS